MIKISISQGPILGRTGDTAKSNVKRTQGQEPTLLIYSPNSEFDEVICQSLVPSHSSRSLCDHLLACSSHTKECE